MTKGSDLIHADKNTFGSQDLGGGLTKREHFAALAMQGLMARPDWAFANVAEHAVEVADALIEALNK
jgi:hypothetical protein